MNEQQLAPMAVGFAAAVVVFVIVGFFWKRKNMTAHLAPVKRELKKEKQWLRRGEYNAAMVKGRQNLELFLKLVAEFNGIYLDNSAQAMANAKNGPDGRMQRESYRMNGRKRQRVMTFQQFGWWLDENGYLDRVGKWELNEIRVIGNKAVHENYVSKEDAWNQYNYMEDLLKIVSDRHANRHRQRGPEIKKSQAKYSGSGTDKKRMSGQVSRPQSQRGVQNQKRGQSQAQNGAQRQQNQSQNRGQKQSQGRGQQTKREGGKKSGDRNAQKEVKASGKPGAEKKKTVQKKAAKAEKPVVKNQMQVKSAQEKPMQNVTIATPERKPRSIVTMQTVRKTEEKNLPAVQQAAEKTDNVQPEKISSSAKRRQRRKRAKEAREAAEAAGMKQDMLQKKKTERPVRQPQPSSAMKIVTLSQSSSKPQTGKTETPKKDAEKQAAKRRRKPVRRPAEKTAVSGGDHEEL